MVLTFATAGFHVPYWGRSILLVYFQVHDGLHNDLFEDVAKVARAKGMPLEDCGLGTGHLLVPRQRVQRGQAWVKFLPLGRVVVLTLLNSGLDLPLRWGLVGTSTRQATLPVRLQHLAILGRPPVIDLSGPRGAELPLPQRLHLGRPIFPGARFRRTSCRQGRRHAAVDDVGGPKLLQSALAGFLSCSLLFAHDRSGWASFLRSPAGHLRSDTHAGQTSSQAHEAIPGPRLCLPASILRRPGALAWGGGDDVDRAQGQHGMHHCHGAVWAASEPARLRLEIAPLGV
mmetsp:Transcript_38997/g.72582  ORF Transcript_38997/g.72582 Transcript_38997/m.72582 type:complete len:286 (-) Transcript_38997:14-871(-)